MVSKKRGRDPSGRRQPQCDGDGQRDSGAQPAMLFNEETNPANVPVSMLPDFVAAVRSEDDKKRLYGTMMIRKLLEGRRPLAEIVASGVCSLFVAFLGRNDFPELQFEAIFALAYVGSASNQHCAYIIDLNPIPSYIALLASPSERCRERAAWATGMLCCDSANSRDCVIQLGALEALLRVIGDPGCGITALRKAALAVSLLCSGTPPPQLEKVAVALPALVTLMKNPDVEVAVHAGWAVANTSHGPNERIQCVLDAGALDVAMQILSQILKAPSSPKHIPAIRIIGCITSGDDKQTQAVIDAGALPAMYTLLNPQLSVICREACWALSNIAAGTPSQTQDIINANLFPQIVAALRSNDYDIRREALWAVANATSGTNDQVHYLTEIGALNQLVEMLPQCEAGTPSLLVVALDAIANILNVGQEEKKEEKSEKCLGYNRFAAMIENNGGFDKIAPLQDHSDPEVSSAATMISLAFFAHLNEGREGAASQLAAQRAPPRRTTKTHLKRKVDYLSFLKTSILHCSCFEGRATQI